MSWLAVLSLIVAIAMYKMIYKSRFFLLVDVRTLLLYLYVKKKERKIISKIVFIFYLTTLDIICLVEKNNIFFEVLSVCF